MAYKKSRGRLVADLFGRSGVFDYDSTRSQEIIVDTTRSGSVANSYLTSTYTSNATFQSALANTNAYIASVSATERSALANTNAYIATKLDSSSYTTADVQSKAALANTNAYIATKLDSSSYTTADVQSKAALANTNSYIASVSATERSALANTNAYIATKLDSSSYTTADVQSKAALANTNAYIATKIADITGESIKDLSDVYSSMSPTDGQVLTYDTTNGWQAENASGGSGSNVIANSATTSATTAHTIDSFPATTWRSAKYVVQMTSGSDYHATEALVLHDGTSTYVTEYGTMYTNASLGTVDADINSGSVRLLVTPTNATTTVKVVRTGVAV